MEVKTKNEKKGVGGVKRRNKGEGTIRKKGNSYEGRVTIEVNGVKKQVSVSNKDKRIVIQEMARMTNEAQNKSYICDNNITVEEWLKKWVNIYKRGTVHNNTLTGYIMYIKQYIIPEMGNYKMQNVKAIHIQQLVYKMKNGMCKTTSKKLSPKTIKETINVLNMAFDVAVENDLLKYNCVEKVELPKLRKVEPKIMTRKEQKEFEKLLSGKYGFTVFLFLLKTGERASEVAGTNWEDIDFENKVIAVRTGWVKSSTFNEELEREENKCEESDLKNESSVRKIPMLFKIEELLLNYRKRYMEINNIKNIEELKGKSLFLTKTGRKVNAEFLWTKLDRFLKKEGFRHIGVHQLRHTFATRCLESGATMKYVKKLLGHSTDEMTNRYTHLLEQFEAEENEKIKDYYNTNFLDTEKERKTYKGKIKGNFRNLRKAS